MKKLLILAASLSLIPAVGSATIIDVVGDKSSLGVEASILATAPTSIEDDTTTNKAQQGFNELQGVLLTTAVDVDGGSIGPGVTVDSHMIFLNTEGGQRGEHFDVQWFFSGEILGVMSDRGGKLEAASNHVFGLSGTTYPGAFNARGLEGNSPSCTNDCYSVSGNVLTLSMVVTEPGDWIRVITRVPEPGSLALIGLGLLGLGLRRRKS